MNNLMFPFTLYSKSERFHSDDQRLYWFTERKDDLWKINLIHQYGRQHGYVTLCEKRSVNFLGQSFSCKLYYRLVSNTNGLIPLQTFSRDDVSVDGKVINISYVFVVFTNCRNCQNIFARKKLKP